MLKTIGVALLIVGLAMVAIVGVLFVAGPGAHGVRDSQDLKFYQMLDAHGSLVQPCWEALLLGTFLVLIGGIVLVVSSVSSRGLAATATAISLLTFAGTAHASCSNAQTAAGLTQSECALYALQIATAEATDLRFFPSSPSWSPQKRYVRWSAADQALTAKISALRSGARRDLLSYDLHVVRLVLTGVVSPASGRQLVHLSIAAHRESARSGH